MSVAEWVTYLAVPGPVIWLMLRRNSMIRAFTVTGLCFIMSIGLAGHANPAAFPALTATLASAIASLMVAKTRAKGTVSHGPPEK